MPSGLLNKEEENVEERSWMESSTVLSSLVSEVIASLYRAPILSCIELLINDHSMPPVAQVVMLTVDH